MIHSFTHSLLSALALISVLSAQLLGMDRGFLCDHDGLPRLTWADHCHGPQRPDCPGEGHDHKSGAPAQEHAEATERLLACKVPAPQPPMPVASGLAPVDWPRWSVVVRPKAAQSIHRPPPWPVDAGPSWPEVLSRTVALLV